MATHRDTAQPRCWIDPEGERLVIGWYSLDRERRGALTRSFKAEFRDQIKQGDVYRVEDGWSLPSLLGACLDRWVDAWFGPAHVTRTLPADPGGDHHSRCGGLSLVPPL